MRDTGGAIELFNVVKTIVTNYLNSRKLAAMVVGTYNGSTIMVNEELPLPVSMVEGEMKGKLSEGDKVRLFRNDGGDEYYILEIIGKRYALIEEVQQNGADN